LVCDLDVTEEDAMSIGKIKDAIFGSAKAKETVPTGADGASSSATPAATSSAPSAATSAAQASPAAAPASVSAAPTMSQIDIEGVLTQRAAESKQKLDWQRSIVDLMKLLGLDSSLASRKELARDLHRKR
jgi:hypothetical protein